MPFKESQAHRIASWRSTVRMILRVVLGSAAPAFIECSASGSPAQRGPSSHDPGVLGLLERATLSETAGLPTGSRLVTTCSGCGRDMNSHTCRELACAFCLIFDFRHREIERSERSGLDLGQFAMVRSDQELPLIRQRDRAQNSGEAVFKTPGASPGRCDDGIRDPPPRCSDPMETHSRLSARITATLSENRMVPSTGGGDGTHAPGSAGAGRLVEGPASTGCLGEAKTDATSPIHLPQRSDRQIWPS
jgi:hypothetical protein